MAVCPNEYKNDVRRALRGNEKKAAQSNQLLESHVINQTKQRVICPETACGISYLKSELSSQFKNFNLQFFFVIYDWKNLPMQMK